MEWVKIMRDLHVARTGVTYTAGQEVEVSNDLAARHEKTGHMKILPAKDAGQNAPEKVKVKKG